jgi:hypothetical protein
MRGKEFVFDISEGSLRLPFKVDSDDEPAEIVVSSGFTRET